MDQHTVLSAVDYPGEGLLRILREHHRGDHISQLAFIHSFIHSSTCGSLRNAAGRRNHDGE